MPKKITDICYVLSYRDPGYVRTRVILSLIKNVDSFRLSTAMNSNRSPLRYLQTLVKLIAVRITKNPQVYILGFRGHEMYWPVRLVTFPKPIIFDEFLNMQDWLVSENNKISEASLAARVTRRYTAGILKSAKVILCDTDLHGLSSSASYGIPKEKYQTLYVATDEEVFRPRGNSSKSKSQFEVFFYGNLAPLHGAKIILESAKALRDQPIHFTLAGGRGKETEAENLQKFIAKHKLNVSYKDWINFDDLPDLMAGADVFIGGPIGKTVQSGRVITGKTYQSLATAAATIVGAIDEEVGFKDKQNCLLVERGSAKSLTDAILWASKNRDKLPKIGQEGRKLYEKTFSVKAQTSKFEKIILRALE